MNIIEKRVTCGSWRKARSSHAVSQSSGIIEFISKHVTFSIGNFHNL